jgi:hypothetical protein
MGMLTSNQKATQEDHDHGALGKTEKQNNNFVNFGKIQEEEDHGFKGIARKKMGTLKKP